MGAQELNSFSEDDFWQVIDHSLDGTSSLGLTMRRQTQLLESALQQLSQEAFIGFARHFSKLYGDACRNDLWAVAYVVMGGCSDDCFMDFRKWLITRGKAVYCAALQNADALCEEFDKIPDGEMPLWEYYIERLFDSRFGTNAYNAVYAQHGFAAFDPNRLRDPQNQWSDDDASIQKLCPNVFDKWNNNHRF